MAHLTSHLPTHDDAMSPQFPKACWYCAHYAYFAAGAGLARCEYPSAPMNRSQPETGCCSWSRVPGVDDDSWQPVGFCSSAENERELWTLIHRRDAATDQTA